MSSVPFQIVPGFAIPFAHAQLPDCDELNAALKTLFIERESQGAMYRNEQPTMSVGKQLFESRFDLFYWQDRPVELLREFCNAAIFKTITELNGYGQDDLAALQMSVDAWFHITRKGGSFGFHNHPMASWSGIYCVDNGYPAGEEAESGMVQFMHPAPTAQMFTDLGVANIRKPWAVRPREYRLEPGQLVIFPSWLMHQVMPYTGEGERVTVAFNAWFRRYEGAKE